MRYRSLFSATSAAAAAFVDSVRREVHSAPGPGAEPEPPPDVALAEAEAAAVVVDWVADDAPAPAAAGPEQAGPADAGPGHGGPETGRPAPPVPDTHCFSDADLARLASVWVREPPLPAPPARPLHVVTPAPDPWDAVLARHIAPPPGPSVPPVAGDPVRPAAGAWADALALWITERDEPPAPDPLWAGVLERWVHEPGTPAAAAEPAAEPVARDPLPESPPRAQGVEPPAPAVPPEPADAPAEAPAGGRTLAEGRFCLGGWALAPGHCAFGAVTFGCLLDEAPAPEQVRIEVSAAQNVPRHGLLVPRDEGFAPDRDGLVLVLAAEDAGPFSMAGRYRVVAP